MFDFEDLKIAKEVGLAVGVYSSIENKRIYQFDSWESAGKFVDRYYNAQKEDHRIYKIWRSGWSATGNTNEHAVFIGKIEAKSFQDACDKLIPATEYAKDYNRYSRSVWACSLHDNEKEAREDFG